MSETVDRWRVAIVGAGPSGFFAAAALVDGQRAEVDLFDRLPTPYGLVRGGVAPDHQKIKAVTRALEKTPRAPGVRFAGNVRLGVDVSLDDLREAYDAVLLTTGAEASRNLGIPGEQAIGSAAATDFVGWYNGHPDHRHHQFPLDTDCAVVVGVGNVAMDVARILACPFDHLRPTDVSYRALDALKASQITDVVILGRRGPAQAAFSTDELREISHLSGVDLVVRYGGATLDPLSEQWLALHPDRGASANVAFLAAREGVTVRDNARVRVHVRLLAAPVEILVKDGRVCGLRVERTVLVGDPAVGLDAVGTGEFETIDCGLVLRAVGYRGLPIQGVPVDKRGVIPNVGGRVTGDDMTGVYVAGWAKRGPSGLIGTNRACARETVAAMWADFEGKTPKNGGNDLLVALQSRGHQVVSWADWERLDVAERKRGEAAGRVREKVEVQAEMLAVIREG